MHVSGENSRGSESNPESSAEPTAKEKGEGREEDCRRKEKLLVDRAKEGTWLCRTPGATALRS